MFSWSGVPSSGLLSAVAAGGAKATALNPSQSRLGRRAENEREGTQAVKVIKDFAKRKLTLVKYEYRF